MHMQAEKVAKVTAELEDGSSAFKDTCLTNIKLFFSRDFIIGNIHGCTYAYIIMMI